MIRKLKILQLVNPIWMGINTVRDYCEAFDLYSRHSFTFASTAGMTAGFEPFPACEQIDFSAYDVVIVHYSSRGHYGVKQFHPDVANALKTFSGYKVLFLQDEYDRTELARKWILEHGINHLFTCVPEESTDVVYPCAQLPDVNFTSCLTGYVPPNLSAAFEVKPLAERPNHIVYRGRELPYVYGDLAREKMMIGKVVKAACSERGIPEDIEWTEEKRVYGRDWIEFLQSGRATLGTESGSNVFDLDGSLTRNVEEALKENSDLTYEEIKERFFEEENLGVKMNQISPKFFEFIASKTPLILFEGNYSGILRPNEHYFPLKKDFSNLPEILDSLNDLDFLEQMAQRTYEEVVGSGKYSYRVFIADVDDAIEAGFNQSEFAPRENLEPIIHDSIPPTMATLQKEEIGEKLDFVSDLRAKQRAKIADFEGMLERREAKIEKLSQKLAILKREGAKRQSIWRKIRNCLRR